MELVDSELAADPEYVLMGHNSADRVRALLAKLHSTAISKNRGSQVSEEGELLFSKFTKQVQKIFDNLPKPLEWISFYTNDLNLLMQTDQKVREVSIQHKLIKSQSRALEKLNKVSKSEFEALVEESTPTQENEGASENPGNRY